MNLKTAFCSILLVMAFSGCLESDSTSDIGTGVTGLWQASGGTQGLDITRSVSTISGLFLWNEIYYPCQGTVSGDTISLTSALLDGTASISATVAGNIMSVSVDFHFMDSTRNYSSGNLTWYRG